MTEPKFTPGEWRRGQDGNLRVYGPDGAGEDSGLIATVHRASCIDLIATAPELYAALNDMVGNCSGCDGTGFVSLMDETEIGQSPGSSSRPCVICSDARAAIAKARGE